MGADYGPRRVCMKGRAGMTGKRVGVDTATRVDWHFMVRLDSKAKSMTYVRPYYQHGQFI